MLFLANAQSVLFARDEEGFGEACLIRRRVKRVTCTAPSLGCKEGVSVHSEEERWRTVV